MTLQVNIAKAKATLSELVARAEAGEDVVLMRNGKPVAKISKSGPPVARGPRKPGAFAKYGPLPPDLFLGPDPDIEAAMDEWRIFPDEA